MDSMEAEICGYVLYFLKLGERLQWKAFLFSISRITYSKLIRTISFILLIYFIVPMNPKELHLFLSEFSR